MYQPTSLGNAFLEACAILFFLCLLLLALLSLFKVPEVGGGSSQTIVNSVREAVDRRGVSVPRQDAGGTRATSRVRNALAPIILPQGRGGFFIDQQYPTSAAPGKMHSVEIAQPVTPATPVTPVTPATPVTPVSPVMPVPPVAAGLVMADRPETVIREPAGKGIETAAKEPIKGKKRDKERKDTAVGARDKDNEKAAEAVSEPSSPNSVKTDAEKNQEKEKKKKAQEHEKNAQETKVREVTRDVKGKEQEGQQEIEKEKDKEKEKEKVEKLKSPKKTEGEKVKTDPVQEVGDKEIVKEKVEKPRPRGGVKEETGKADPATDKAKAAASETAAGSSDGIDEKKDKRKVVEEAAAAKEVKEAEASDGPEKAAKKKTIEKTRSKKTMGDAQGAREEQDGAECEDSSKDKKETEDADGYEEVRKRGIKKAKAVDGDADGTDPDTTEVNPQSKGRITPKEEKALTSRRQAAEKRRAQQEESNNTQAVASRAKDEREKVQDPLAEASGAPIEEVIRPPREAARVAALERQEDRKAKSHAEAQLQETGEPVEGYSSFLAEDKDTAATQPAASTGSRSATADEAQVEDAPEQSQKLVSPTNTQKARSREADAVNAPAGQVTELLQEVDPSRGDPSTSAQPDQELSYASRARDSQLSSTSPTLGDAQSAAQGSKPAAKLSARDARRAERLAQQQAKRMNLKRASDLKSATHAAEQSHLPAEERVDPAVPLTVASVAPAAINDVATDAARHEEPAGSGDRSSFAEYVWGERERQQAARLVDSKSGQNDLNPIPYADVPPPTYKASQPQNTHALLEMWSQTTGAGRDIPVDSPPLVVSEAPQEEPAPIPAQARLPPDPKNDLPESPPETPLWIKYPNEKGRQRAADRAIQTQLDKERRKSDAAAPASGSKSPTFFRQATPSLESTITPSQAAKNAALNRFDTQSPITVSKSPSTPVGTSSGERAAKVPHVGGNTLPGGFAEPPWSFASFAEPVTVNNGLTSDPSATHKSLAKESTGRSFGHRRQSKGDEQLQQPDASTSFAKAVSPLRTTTVNNMREAAQKRDDASSGALMTLETNAHPLIKDQIEPERLDTAGPHKGIFRDPSAHEQAPSWSFESLSPKTAGDAGVPQSQAESSEPVIDHSESPKSPRKVTSKRQSAGLTSKAARKAGAAAAARAAAQRTEMSDQEEPNPPATGVKRVLRAPEQSDDIAHPSPEGSPLQASQVKTATMQSDASATKESHPADNRGGVEVEISARGKSRGRHDKRLKPQGQKPEGSSFGRRSKRKKLPGLQLSPNSDDPAQTTSPNGEAGGGATKDVFHNSPVSPISPAHLAASEERKGRRQRGEIVTPSPPLSIASPISTQDMPIISHADSSIPQLGSTGRSQGSRLDPSQGRRGLADTPSRPPRQPTDTRSTRSTYPPAPQERSSNHDAASTRKAAGLAKSVEGRAGLWQSVKLSPFWSTSTVLIASCYLLGAWQLMSLAQRISPAGSGSAVVRRQSNDSEVPAAAAADGSWVDTYIQWLTGTSLFALINVWHAVSLLVLIVLVMVVQAKGEESSDEEADGKKTGWQRVKAAPLIVWSTTKTIFSGARCKGWGITVQIFLVLFTIAAFAACLLYTDFMVAKLANISPELAGAQSSGVAALALVNFVFLVFVPLLTCEFVLCLQAYLRWYRLKDRDRFGCGSGSDGVGCAAFSCSCGRPC